MIGLDTNVLISRVCVKTPVSKCGAGYQPAAALWAALVFNTEKPAGSRLPAK
jgi:hypothetical protein